MNEPTALTTNEGLTDASKTAKDFANQITILLAVLEDYRDDKDFSRIFEIDLSRYAETNLAFEEITSAVAALRQAQKAAADSAADAFRALVPDSTYGPLLQQLQIV